jgi:hypothetical protein
VPWTGESGLSGPVRLLVADVDRGGSRGQKPPTVNASQLQARGPQPRWPRRSHHLAETTTFRHSHSQACGHIHLTSKLVLPMPAFARPITCTDPANGAGVLLGPAATSACIRGLYPRSTVHAGAALHWTDCATRLV